MKTLGRLLAYLSLVMGGFLAAQLKPIFSPLWTTLLTPVKLLAVGLAPLWAVVGVVGALYGLRTGSSGVVVAGLVGALIAGRHMRRMITPPTDPFVAVFGAEWRAYIRADLLPRLPEQRWTPMLPEVPEPQFERDVIYAQVPNGGGDLLCDLWQPPPGVVPSGLAYVYLHGGGWALADKDLLTRPIFRRLAAQGHVIMDVAYRQYPETNMGGILFDCKRAIAWMKANADHFGVDPDLIVVGGGSAGGQLALLTAYTADHRDLTPPDLRRVDTSVRGVVGMYPVVDLKDYYRYNDYGALKFSNIVDVPDNRVVLENLLDGSPEVAPQLFELFSPVAHICPDMPPALLMIGAHDDAVPVAPVRSYAARLTRQGNQAVYVELPQAEHGFDVFLPTLSPAAQAALYDLSHFLALMASKPR
ncbi:MAG: alpha/beta hydrolase, partial [Chloroflexi bacterium]|nr:alpha/beta hydrolase [Chloroflexota bacterium]